jgi:hypothetical protein
MFRRDTVRGSAAVIPGQIDVSGAQALVMGSNQSGVKASGTSALVLHEFTTDLFVGGTHLLVLHRGLLSHPVMINLATSEDLDAPDPIVIEPDC